MLYQLLALLRFPPYTLPISRPSTTTLARHLVTPLQEMKGIFALHIGLWVLHKS